MRREIEAQNEAIAGAQFGGTNVVQFVAPLRRIFNEKLSQGGRCYAEGGGWQILSKAERLQLQIAGESVVEVDYSQFHPALAYAELGFAAPPDAYDVPGAGRPLVKIAFNIMLNGRSRHGARWEIAHAKEMAPLVLGLDCPEGVSAFEVEAARPGYLRAAMWAAQGIINALLAKHAPIASLFFTSVGLRLQRMDSDIAEGVMREMRRREIVVLPVHDSFLAPASKSAELEAVMIDVAAKFGAAVSCKRSSTVPTA